MLGGAVGGAISRHRYGPNPNQSALRLEPHITAKGIDSVIPLW